MPLTFSRKSAGQRSGSGGQRSGSGGRRSGSRRDTPLPPARATDSEEDFADDEDVSQSCDSTLRDSTVIGEQDQDRSVNTEAELIEEGQSHEPDIEVIHGDDGPRVKQDNFEEMGNSANSTLGVQNQTQRPKSPIPPQGVADGAEGGDTLKGIAGSLAAAGGGAAAAGMASHMGGRHGAERGANSTISGNTRMGVQSTRGMARGSGGTMRGETRHGTGPRVASPRGIGGATRRPGRGVAGSKGTAGRGQMTRPSRPTGTAPYPTGHTPASTRVPPARPSTLGPLKGSPPRGRFPAINDKPNKVSPSTSPNRDNPPWIPVGIATKAPQWNSSTPPLPPLAGAASPKGSRSPGYSGYLAIHGEPKAQKCQPNMQAEAYFEKDTNEKILNIAIRGPGTRDIPIPSCQVTIAPGDPINGTIPAEALVTEPMHVNFLIRHEDEQQMGVQGGYQPNELGHFPARGVRRAGRPSDRNIIETRAANPPFNFRTDTPKGRVRVLNRRPMYRAVVRNQDNDGGVLPQLNKNNEGFSRQ